MKAGSYKTFSGLTLRNTMKHCPSSDATIKGHLKQRHQGLCSTKPKPTSSNRFAPLATPDAPTTDKPDDLSHKPTALPPTNELYIMDFLLAKLYTDDTGGLPIWACSGNQYITIAFHSCCSAILCAPYVNRSNKHQLAAYDSIMRRLANRGHNVISKSSTMKSAPNSRPPMWTSGKFGNSLSLWTYIVAMLTSKPFKPSSPTSLPSLPVYLLPSPVTFGTCSFHKLS
jgi:hypothetical protein